MTYEILTQSVGNFTNLSILGLIFIAFSLLLFSICLALLLTPSSFGLISWGSGVYVSKKNEIGLVIHCKKYEDPKKVLSVFSKEYMDDWYPEDKYVCFIRTPALICGCKKKYESLDDVCLDEKCGHGNFFIKVVYEP